MNAPAAFKATIHGIRTLPSRKVVQIVVEAPIEELARIAAIAEHGAWVAVARIINPEIEYAALVPAPRPHVEGSSGYPPDGGKPSTKSLAQQAAIWCNDPTFRHWIGAKDSKDCAEQVRDICNVASRRELKVGTAQGAAWSKLLEQFQGWKAAERVGAI